MTGGTDADIFVLGDELGIYYDDGFGHLSGDLDYAMITDLNVMEDRIILHGSISQYSLTSAASGLGLNYLNANGASELIATFTNSPADLSLDSGVFAFV